MPSCAASDFSEFGANQRELIHSRNPSSALSCGMPKGSTASGVIIASGSGSRTIAAPQNGQASESLSVSVRAPQPEHCTPYAPTCPVGLFADPSQSVNEC